MALQSNDRAEFMLVLTRTAGMYRVDMSKDLVDLYWEALIDYDLAAVRDGLSRHIRNPDAGQFMPKPADIIRNIGGSTTDTALLAWAKVHDAIRKLGTWRDPVFDDPLIHCVLGDMGGWVLLCSTLEANLPFRAKEFENRYRAFARMQASPTRVPRLMGLASQGNMSNGLEAETPSLVGDLDKCVKVLALMNGAAANAPALSANESAVKLPVLKRVQ